MCEYTDQIIHYRFVQTNHLVSRLLESPVVHYPRNITRWHFYTFIIKYLMAVQLQKYDHSIAYDMIFSFVFVHCNYCIVAYVETAKMLDILLHHLIQALQSMKKTNALTTHYWHTWITFIICLPYQIPIYFNIVCHRILEVYVWHSILRHDLKIFQKII